ncbi:hypothetical protein [Bernardetia sp.]|uniref:hypothetical protein n=1 Tax=Bernardetia sp. TaxID=1937974 RepID=UPI0025BA00E1|nr:hypothetical protein [Bernardetia sp.]
MSEVRTKSENLSEDNITDERYQLEDKKRKLAQEIDNATKDKQIQVVKKEYAETKEECARLVSEHGNDYEQKTFNDIVSREQTFLTSNSSVKIKEATSQLHTLIIQILWHTPEFLVAILKDLQNKIGIMNDQNQANMLLEAGISAANGGDWQKLGDINQQLVNLLPKRDRDKVTRGVGF